MDKVGAKTLEVMSQAENYNLWLFERINPYVGGDILEVGSGIGNFTKLLVGKGRVFALDYDRSYLGKLRKIVGNDSGYGDVERGKYFFRNRKFDTIVCMNVLEHIKNDEKALSNIKSLLKKNGRLILLVPAHQMAYGLMDKKLGHYRRYDRKNLKEKLEMAGFKVSTTFYLNMLGLLGWWFNGKILKKTIIPNGQLKIFDIISMPFLSLEGKISPPFGLSVVGVAQNK